MGELQTPFAASRDGTVVSIEAASLALVEVTSYGQKRRLGPESGLLRHPRWSPDGLRIAYTRGGIGTAQIWIREMPSGRENRLVLSDNAVFPVWTHDGRVVYFDPSGGENSILRSGGSAEKMPGKFRTRVSRGDVLSVKTPGGGGWGRRS